MGGYSFFVLLIGASIGVWEIYNSAAELAGDLKSAAVEEVGSWDEKLAWEMRSLEQESEGLAVEEMNSNLLI